jgi:hypothetical protein
LHPDSLLEEKHAYTRSKRSEIENCVMWLRQGNHSPKISRVLRHIYTPKHTKTYTLPVGGKMFLTKMKMAFSGLSLILFRTTYTNCPTVKSAGTRYLHSSKREQYYTPQIRIKQRK